jgi:hypothetical protein
MSGFEPNNDRHQLLNEMDRVEKYNYFTKLPGIEV